MVVGTEITRTQVAGGGQVVLAALESEPVPAQLPAVAKAPLAPAVVASATLGWAGNVNSVSARMAGVDGEAAGMPILDSLNDEFVR